MGALPVGGTQTSTPATSSSSFLQGAGALGGAALALNNNGGAPRPPAATALTAAQSPSTPVKKQTVMNTDGSSTSTEYHAPPTLPQAPTASTASATTPSEPAYNPSQPATTVYNNGMPTTNQGGTVVSGYLPANSQTNSSTAPNGGNTNTVIPGQLSTYPGIVSGLASSALQGSPAAQGYTAQTAQYGAGNVPIGQEAAAIGQQYGLDYNAATQAGTSQEGHEMTTGGLSGVGEGNAAVTAGVLAQQQQGIAQSAATALQGLGVQETAQNQAANAANEAAGAANVGQTNVQSGLNAAGTLAQPALGSIGQVPYSPLDLSQSAPLGTTQPGGVAAAGNLLGQFQGAQALGAAQGTGAAQGIQAQAAAPGQTQASNIQASGTAVTGANATGLAQSIQQETTLDTAASNATALANQVSTALTNSGLNLTNSTDANTAISNLQSRLGNSAYTQLNIAVNDARNAYGAILQATGATPTDAGNAANQNINANMSPKQILAAIDQLSQGVNARQQSQHAQTQQYQSQLSGSGTEGSTGNSGGSYTSSSGATYTLPY